MNLLQNLEQDTGCAVVEVIARIRHGFKSEREVRVFLRKNGRDILCASGAHRTEAVAHAREKWQKLKKWSGDA